MLLHVAPSRNAGDIRSARFERPEWVESGQSYSSAPDLDAVAKHDRGDHAMPVVGDDDAMIQMKFTSPDLLPNERTKNLSAACG